jgi:uncharacterized membrane protein YeaQ/YmgE (transglycosylase-associated protein family)
MSPPWGLLAWLGLGLVLGVVAQVALLPAGARQRRGGCLTLFLAVFGALAGGLVATALDFGGLVELDPLSLAPAGLLSLLLILLLRLAQGRRAGDAPR